MTRERDTRFPSAGGALFASLAALITACGGGGDGDETTPDPPKTYDLSSGEATVTVDSDGITLTRGSLTLLRLPREAFTWGTVAALEDLNYDPYRLYVPHPLHQVPEITWIAPERMEVKDPAGSSLSVRLVYPGGAEGALTIEAPGPDRFTLLWKPASAEPPIAHFRLRARASAEEGFYGLGEYFDDVSHRGKVRAMQIEIDPTIESGYNEAHVPVPFLTGTTGWGLFVESDRPGAFAVAADEGEPDLVEATFGTGAGSPDGLRFHLFAAAHPLDVTRLYYQVTGSPRLPARWALGPWVWRDENKDQAQFLADAHAIRDLDLAATGMWIDRPYATAVNTFDFLPSQFPDPQAMIDEAHGLGFRMALWHTPYLDEDAQADATKDLRAEAEAEGYYPVTKGLLLNKWGSPIDLTNPGARAWWRSLIEKYKAMGVEGYKLDYAEDVVPGLTNARNVWEFHDGSDERTMHAGYQRFYHSVYGETLPEDGGFLLCRGGAAGDQVNVGVIWPGDLDATFHRHREPFEENGETVTGVGGLPASIVAGLSLGPSGFPFFGADTGGYKHSPPDKELFTRWFEQTAFSTVMQIGTSSNTVAWDFTSGPGFDDEMLGWYRLYTRLHLRLFPYLWTYALRLAEDGRPIARPLGLAHPEMGIHPNDVYLLGDHLLVAPVVERGATSREVPLPAGRWIDFWTGEAHEGDAVITVPAPLGRIPVLMPEGAIVPMLRPTIDTMTAVSAPDQIDSYATSPGPLHARIVPGPGSTFRVFDGTEIEVALGGDHLTLVVTEGEELTGGFHAEIRWPGAAPESVIAGGASLPQVASLAALDAEVAAFFHDPAAGGVLHVKLGAGDQSVTVWAAP